MSVEPGQSVPSPAAPPVLRDAERLDEVRAPEVARDLGLLPREYAAVRAGLGRVPGRSELTLFAGMWSEHCSYKSTRPWLSGLPREGAGLLAGPGSHAGTVDVGEGWAVAFKIESHNHPSAVEPYQGAATGVGGILRDVVAQGARPVAVMDSLCFGDLDDPRTRFLESGVVSGIAGYGNAYGVPNVGGMTQYDPRYTGNPLVNALAAGLLRHDALRDARAAGVGNGLLYVGATTGRDGILGAAFASEELGAENTSRRSHVQVGDPFMGKKLMEACLAFDARLGMVAGQDMGACGISCAVTEMAAAGGTGVEVELERVPRREDDMLPHELLLSESQERFLYVVRQDLEAEAVRHFATYGVHAAIVGRLVAGDRVRVTWHGETVVDVPAGLVAGGCPPTAWPVAEALPPSRPYPSFPPVHDLRRTLLDLLSMPGIADTEPLWSRYDQTVGNRTVRGPGQAEAAVLKLPASRRGFALVITGRGDVCGVDPYQGARAAVADGLRRLACAGARLVAITDGINHGSPRDPVENLRLAETLRGLGDALRDLGIPVTGGNVSLYNESPLGAIPPTPMVGSLGLVEDVARVPRRALRAGDRLVLLGRLSDRPTVSCFGRLTTGSDAGESVEVDLEAEAKLARVLLDLVREHRVETAVSTGRGGLLVALAKASLASRLGVELTQLDLGDRRPDWALFGEAPAQVWLGVDPASETAVLAACRSAGVPAQVVGTVGGSRFEVHGLVSVCLEELGAAFHHRRPGLLSGGA